MYQKRQRRYWAIRCADIDAEHPFFQAFVQDTEFLLIAKDYLPVLSFDSLPYCKKFRKEAISEKLVPVVSNVSAVDCIWNVGGGIDIRNFGIINRKLSIL